VRKLAGEGYILDGTYSIIDAWKKLDSFTPRDCDFKCTIPTNIENILNEWGIDRING
jgi:hypothetical protein